MTGRKCGDCGACCVVLGVAGFKEPCVTCQHLKPRGTNRCGIYGSPEKPEDCSTYQCGWLQGLLGPNDRPDRLGLIFELSVQDECAVVTAREVWTGAADGAVAARVLDGMSTKSAIIVVRFNSSNRKLLCRDYEIVKKLRPRLANLGIHV